jgi:hypothetical protein
MRVVRPAEYVEAGAPEELHEVRQWDVAVAPGGVRVQLAEQWSHHPHPFGIVA